MKKFLALFLCIAMLASCVVISTSAADAPNHYWNFPKDSYFAPIQIGNQDADLDVEFDFSIDGTAAQDFFAGITGWSGLGNGTLTSNGPYISTTFIGIGDENAETNENGVAITVTCDEWHHIKYDAAGGNTTVYFDGANLGTFTGVCNAISDGGVYWKWMNVSIDNLRIGTYFNDMESGGIVSFGGMNAQGVLVEEGGGVPEDLFERISTVAPSGDALVISGGYNETSHYYDIETMAANTKNLIINFDLALYKSSCQKTGNQNADTWFEFWLDEDCQNRVCIGTQAVGMQKSMSNNWKAYKFGEGVQNFHNVTVAIYGTYNILNIYIDKTLVYEGTPGLVEWLDGSRTSRNGYGTYLVGNVWNGTAVIDNYKIYDGKTLEVIPTSYTNSGNPASAESERIISLDNICADYHIPGVTTTTSAETCYQTGEETTICAVCGERITHVVPSYAHNWASYDINRTNEDGLVYTYCKNANCPEKRYTALPENYTGKLYQVNDFRDDLFLATATNAGFNNRVVLDNGTFGEGGQGYWYVENGKLCSRRGKAYGYNVNDVVYPANSWSWDMDISFDGLFNDAPGATDVASYGHVVYIWCGGSNSIFNKIGYNFDKGEFFIKANDGASYKTKSKACALNFGETYNVKITYEYDNRDYTACIKLFLNGVEMCRVSDEDDEEICLLLEAASGKETSTFNIFRSFGVDVSIDQWVYGSADFAYTDRIYDGDADGDFALTTSDAVALRKYFSGASETIACLSRADINKDSQTNAKDLLAIRTELAK